MLVLDIFLQIKYYFLSYRIHAYVAQTPFSELLFFNPVKNILLKKYLINSPPKPKNNFQLKNIFVLLDLHMHN